MGLLSDYTLQQIRQATAEQIRTAISNKLANLTKKQLCILILKVADIDVESFEAQDREEGVDGPHGQLWRKRVTRDVLNQVLRKENIAWSYYPTGEVDEITITQLDPADKVLSKKTVKHFKGVKQPEEIL